MLEHYGLMLALGCAVLAIVYGMLSARWVVAQPSGNARMQEIAAAIQEGARAYLNRQYLAISIAGVVLFVLVGLFLSWYTFKTLPLPRIVLLMKIALAVTFICHGLYAVGYYPVPGSFQSMLMQIFPLTEMQTIGILKVAGVLDFILSIVIFLPQRRILLIALGYATVWGLLTALARPVAHFYPQFWLESLLQWIPEFLFRVPHFLLPVWLFIFYKKSLINQ